MAAGGRLIREGGKCPKQQSPQPEIKASRVLLCLGDLVGLGADLEPGCCGQGVVWNRESLEVAEMDLGVFPSTGGHSSYLLDCLICTKTDS